jgi:hypothetical protein
VDFIRYCEDRGIEYRTEGHKHCTAGWVQVACPMCTGSHEGYHLGFCISGEYFRCWRCGFHWPEEVIRAFDNCGWSRAKAIRSQYASIQSRQSEFAHSYSPRKRILHEESKVITPVTRPLTPPHRQYLHSRRFRPDDLVRDWGIESTGPVGPFKHRIFIPIAYRRRMVSYQTRSTTSSYENRYLACPSDREALHYKYLLYGMDWARDLSVLVVEGVTGVWRIGRGTVATFGIGFTHEQAVLLSRWMNVTIAFDPGEIPAATSSQSLGETLTLMGVRVQLVDLDLPRDTGELSDSEVRELRAVANL